MHYAQWVSPIDKGLTARTPDDKAPKGREYIIPFASRKVEWGMGRFRDFPASFSETTMAEEKPPADNGSGGQRTRFQVFVLEAEYTFNFGICERLFRIRRK